jgi:hypothetical protein
MMRKHDACAACGASAPGLLRRLVVDGRTIVLCRPHAAFVATTKPESFEQLRALFRATVSRPDGTAERRCPIPRRDGVFGDRRMFPPRPEGRRRGGGRRGSDPAE